MQRVFGGFFFFFFNILINKLYIYNGEKKKNLILINSQCQHNFEELSKSQNMTSKKYLSFCSKSHFSNKKI